MLLKSEIQERILDPINHLIQSEEFNTIPQYIQMIHTIPDRREREFSLEAVRENLISAAFKKNNPELLVYGIDKYNANNGEIAVCCIQEYLKNQNKEWLTTANTLLQTIERKNLRSEYQCRISEQLIDEGIYHSNPDIIEIGISFSEKVDFKKKREELAIRIIPKLITYSITSRNILYLETSSELLDFVRDAHIQTELQIQIIRGLTSIGIVSHDAAPIFEAFRRAGEIHQKRLKEEGFRAIFELFSIYKQKKFLFDIAGFVKNYLNFCNEESRKEYISAYTTILISSKREDDALCTDLSKLFAIAPDQREEIITIILKDAHVDSFDQILKALLSEITTKDLYLNEQQAKKLLQLAIQFHEDARNDSDLITIYTIIRDRDVIFQNNSATYDLIKILIRTRHLESAYELLARVAVVEERRKGRFLHLATMLIEESLIFCDITPFHLHLFPQIKSDHAFLNEIIENSLASFISKRSFAEIQESIETIVELSRLHSSTDDALRTLLSLFLEKNEVMYPHLTMILNLTGEIREKTTQDISLSQILVRIATEGVLEQNRDLIQQAVAISCMIKGDLPRIDAISHIIDIITSLAIRDGDLDLMTRISNWCLELLEDKTKEETLQKVIMGLIRFGTDRSSIIAINLASSRIHELQNTKNRKELTKSCICAYISLGCSRFEVRGITIKPDILEWAMEPFLLAITTLREGILPDERMQILALATDVILDYETAIDPLPYTIPITLLLLEDVNHNNRKATLLRSTTRLNSLSLRIDHNNPYETILQIIREFPSAMEAKTVLKLMKQTAVEIQKPYSQFMMLASITKGYLTIGDTQSANEILNDIRLKSELLNVEEASEILTECAILYTSIDSFLARACILEAKAQFDKVPDYISSHAKQKLIFALITYQEKFGPDINIPNPESILQTIIDPKYYISSTISLLKIIDDENKKKYLLKHSYDRILSLTVPFDCANLLADFVSSPDLSIPWEDKQIYIRKIIEISKEIQIPFITYVILRKILINLTGEHSTDNDKQILGMLVELLNNIEDETRRMNMAEELGLLQLYERETDQNEMPWAILHKCRINSKRGIDFSRIERTLYSITDRGVRARYKLGIAMLLREHSQTKRVERLIQQAILDASVIRPLPRRAFILVDLALTCFSNGEHDYGGVFFDMAMATATNITTGEIRENVFEELDIAMHLIQEMDEYTV